MSKQFLAVIVIIILAFVGIFAFSGNKSNTSDSSSSGKASPTKHIEGQGQAGVTLVEYGDFQCTYCAQYYPVVKQVVAEFNKQIFFQFRNFPLVNVHQNAFAAARAAEAAGLQDKYWQMHDLLYINQSQWSESSNALATFKQYAKQLELNMTKFESDYSSSQVNDVINADSAEGNKLNVQGTPTFFLDGKQLQVSANAASFEQQIKAEIAQKTRR